jgi:DNA-binding transcriptional LysR family regulator
MAKLDLDWLPVFIEVYKTRSVSRAAQRLGIAQATASIALNKLRLHFDDRLFSRTSRGMEPTPRAERIYPELQQVLARLDVARGARQDFVPAQAERSFRICITDISEIVLLPRLINHLSRVAPRVAIEVEKTSDATARRLESGDVDLAIGFMPDLEAGFYQQTLFEQDFVCLAAARHPRVRSNPTRRAFLAEKHIVVASVGTGHAIVDKVLAKQGLDRQVVLRLASFLGVARIVAQTELLVLVPRLLGETLALQERIQVLDPPVPLPTYGVKQHWHERFHADAANVWLRKTFAELFSQPDRKRAGRSVRPPAGVRHATP